MKIFDTIPEISTLRLRLRTPLDSDVPRIVELAHDREIARMTTGVPFPYTMDHGHAFLSMVRAADPEIDLPLLIEHKTHGPVGLVGLHRREQPWPEIGYWLGRAYWGQGIATEAAAALVNWGHAVRGLKAISSAHFADNPASGRVLEKLDFLYTGQITQRLSYGRGTEAPTRMMIRLG
jgi:RimJ/RimL family protein N-acetyltransferase